MAWAITVLGGPLVWAGEIAAPDPAPVTASPRYAARSIDEWMDYLSQSAGTRAWREREIESGMALDYFKTNALPALDAALGHPDSMVRTFAIRRIARLGKAAAPAFPRLVCGLIDQDNAVRVSAVAAVNALLLVSDETIIMAITFLDDGDARMRRAMAEQLGSIAGRAAPALDALRKLENDVEPRVLEAARSAVGFIEP